MTKNILLALSCLLAVPFTAARELAAQSHKNRLPDPDGKSANMRKQVKVFILMGQSNMLGAGKVGPENRVGSLQLAVDGKKGQYKQFRGNVASVYANPFCHGGSANSHYGGNAKTYMDVGLAMGEAMVELIKKGK